MLTHNDLERERYEARLKFQRDQNARMQFAEEKGKKRGAIIGRVQACEMVLKQQPTPLEALDALTLEQLQELADRLFRCANEKIV
jgi:ABC-type taurine transport system ATPase subunit